MTRIIDTNRHGIRREIDHQYKPKKRPYKPKPRTDKLSTDNTKLSTAISTDIDISIENTINVDVKQANNA